MCEDYSLEWSLRVFRERSVQEWKCVSCGKSHESH